MTDIVSFDYAMKYMLKDKADFEIIEGFISAIIGSEGYKPVKVTSLLETESNAEASTLKRSVADCMVEDEDGVKYIVEIDKSYTDLFLSKAVFNTSRLIVDNLGVAEDYSKIKKVFHINLLYFPLKYQNGKATSPLHHGKVVFHEVEKDRTEGLHLMDRNMKIVDLSNVFPEYFVISVPLFDDVIKQELDEWLYMLKNSKTKEDFKSPYMKKVEQRLNVLKMSQAEREEFRSISMQSHKERDYLVAAQAKGIAEGIAEGEARGEARGKAEAKIELAKEMLKEGYEIDVIAKLTKLSLEEINSIRY